MSTINTNREFLSAVVASDVSDEIKAFAQNEILKLDNRNAKRRATPSKASQENEKYIPEVLALFTTPNTVVTASEVASQIVKEYDENSNPVYITPQKATSILHSIDGLEKFDAKVGKSKVKAYRLATSTEVDE